MRVEQGLTLYASSYRGYRVRSIIYVYFYVSIFHTDDYDDLFIFTCAPVLGHTTHVVFTSRSQ
jgi:hypothetical protein